MLTDEIHAKRFESNRSGLPDSELKRLTGVVRHRVDFDDGLGDSCHQKHLEPGYCDEQVIKMIERQSQELDPAKRLALVKDIQAKLEADAARPTMGWRLDFFPQWPHVKNLTPHHNIYNYGRMQDVWLDR